MFAESYISDNDLYVFLNKKLETKESYKRIGIGDYIFTYDNSLLILYDDNFEEVRKIYFDEKVDTITKVTKVENNILAIDYIATGESEADTIYIDDKDNIYQNKYGKLLRKTENYLVYKRDKKLYIVDYNGKELNSIEGNKIKLYNDYLVVDNNLYKIVIK